jgi:hypothetical protein
MNRVLGAASAFVAIAVVIVFGFRQGERASTQTFDVARNPKPPAAAPAPKPAAAAHAPRMALPDSLDSLDGAEFIAAMPELEQRARDGDQKAALLLIHRLQECTYRAVQGVDEIRAGVDSEYARQLDIQKKWGGDNAVVIDEAWRANELKKAFDFRDRCLALTAQARGRRLDVAELALARHERDVVLDLVRGSLFAEDAERVRYVDRLGAIADAERREIGRLVEAGDREAMDAAVVAYSSDNFGVIEADWSRAYAIAYALSLAGGLPQFRMEWLQHRVDALLTLPGQDLSPEQVEAARAEGAALYSRCCAGGGSRASH